MITVNSEEIKQPLQETNLWKKYLGDYVINVASGCLHGCSFCYVPSTPAIRARETHLQERGVEDPQDWGSYLIIRDNAPEKLEKILSGKRSWKESYQGRGVVLLCSGTDPYQNNRVANITRQCIEILLSYNKRVRILTRSPLFLNDLDLLANTLVTTGVSIPTLDDAFCRTVEMKAPRPSDRYRAIAKASEAGCRVYIAMAPTPPFYTQTDFSHLLTQFLKVNPEVIFWEPINLRGGNVERMSHLPWAEEIRCSQTWAKNFFSSWSDLKVAAQELNCLDLIMPWFDPDLKNFNPPAGIDWNPKQTPEQWNDSNLSGGCLNQSLAQESGL